MANEVTLNTLERKELEKQEKVILKGMQTFVEVGSALSTIRDKKLYREEYKTFEQYCSKKWGFQRRRAYQLIEEATVTQNVQDLAQKPPVNSEQARPLAQLPDEQQGEAWQEAQREAGTDQPTGKQVAEVVDRRLGKSGNGKKKSGSDAQPTGDYQPESGGDGGGQGESEPEPRRDKAGQPVPQALESVFEAADRWRRIATDLTKTCKQLQSEAQDGQPHATAIEVGKLKTNLTGAAQALRRAAPYAVCSECRGKGCENCDGDGWLTQQAYKRDVKDAEAAAG